MSKYRKRRISKRSEQLFLAFSLMGYETSLTPGHYVVKVNLTDPFFCSISINKCRAKFQSCPFGSTIKNLPDIPSTKINKNISLTINEIIEYINNLQNN